MSDTAPRFSGQQRVDDRDGLHCIHTLLPVRDLRGGRTDLLPATCAVAEAEIDQVQVI